MPRLQKYKPENSENMRMKNSEETINSHNSTTREITNTDLQEMPEVEF